MPWYHYVAAYMMIGAFFAFVVVPEKSLKFVGVLALIGIVAFLMMILLPGGEDPVWVEYERKQKEKELAKPPE